MNIKDLTLLLNDIIDNRMIKYDVVVDAVKEGLAKAYRKHINCADCNVEVNIDEKSGDIKVYQVRDVIDTEVIDDELEISVEDAQDINPELKAGDKLIEEVSIREFGRSDISQFKSVMLQKIKEASKQMVYDEYCDKVDDLVNGTVQTVEAKFVLIDLGKTLALLPKKNQIRGEKYYDGQRLKVVIEAVNKDSKGAQVVVSRNSANLVKRLFEASVTEIYDGTVEIKAIAREDGERTKMAVHSNNANVDAIGACIGPRGSRVLGVIEEINLRNNPVSHENIDIIEWSDDMIQYVSNAFKPAEVISVFPDEEEENKLIVIVPDNQLSLAIGKKGVNARLASRLLDKKVDIKTVSDAEELGIDYAVKKLEYQAELINVRRRKEAELIAERQRKAEEEAAAKAEAARLEAERLAELKKAEEEAAAAVKPEEAPVEEHAVEPVAEPVVEPQPVKEETKVEAEPVSEPEEEKEEKVKKRKPKLEKAKEYVSKYEELADAKKSAQKTTTSKRRKTKEDEDEAELRKKLEALKSREYDIKPEYSEEELDEFNDEEDHWYDEDVDYDDFDEFYDN